MKKYRVTDKHPYFKTDGILEFDGRCSINGLGILLSDQDIERWLSTDWIKEIQEPKFTKNDLVDFLEYLLKQNDRHCEIEPIEFVDEWINEK